MRNLLPNKAFPLLVLLVATLTMSCDSGNLDIGIEIDQAPYLTIEAPDADLAEFGKSIAVSDELLVVTGTANDGKGRIYSYRWNGRNPVFTNMVEAPETSQNSVDFGRELEICSDAVLVGAPQSGIAMVLVDNGEGLTWIGGIRPRPLHISDGAFPTAISCSGNIAVFAADRYRGGLEEKNSGAAFVYFGGQGLWALAVVLTPPEPSEDDRFGFSVDISDSKLVIGALARGDEFPHGVFYGYRRDDRTWFYDGPFAAPNIDIANRFGREVELLGNNNLAVGAQGSLFGNPPGTIHYFDSEAEQWNYISNSDPISDFAINYGDNFITTDDNLILASEKSQDEQHSIVVMSQLSFNTSGVTASAIKAFASPVEGDNSSFGATITEYEDKVIITEPSRRQIHFYSK